MAGGVAIVRAGLADAALLAQLHASSLGSQERGTPWDEEAMARLVAGPGTLSLIGLSEGADPSGFLIARLAADEAEVLALGVVPNRRRLGMGRSLMEHAIAVLAAGGARRLFLEVEDGNLAAERLYCSLGAKMIGQRPKYYENGADAVIFGLALSPPHSDDARSAYESYEDQR